MNIKQILKQPIKTKIKISESTMKIKHLNNQYNKAGFLAQSLIPIVDDLIETTKPKFALKKACNDLVRECEKMTSEHYNNFSDFGKVDSPDGSHESLDIYQLTAKAYDTAIEFFTQRSPNEVVSIMEIIRRLEDDGVNLSDIAISYEPLK